MRQEIEIVAAGGRPVARAAARMLALEARKMLRDAEDILGQAGEVDAAKVADKAADAASDVIAATYDGPNQVFACKR